MIICFSSWMSTIDNVGNEIVLTDGLKNGEFEFWKKSIRSNKCFNS